VLKGFIIGLALTILIGQLPKVFGVEKGEGNFFQKAWDLLTRLGDTSAVTLVVGVLSLVVLLGLRRWLPAVPGSIVVVGVAIAAVQLLDLGDHGVALVGVPPVSVDRLLLLVAPAAGLMLVGFAEGLAAAKAYAIDEALAPTA
jgi:sulfate permease, SulP family